MPSQPVACFLVKIARAEQGASCFPVSGKCPVHNCSELNGDTFAVKWLNAAPVRVRGKERATAQSSGGQYSNSGSSQASCYWALGVCAELLPEQSSPYTERAGGAISGPLQANVTTVLNCKCHRLKTNQTLRTSRAPQQRIQQEGGLTFQERKLTGSTTVGWMISLPGKMPQVTALGCRSGALVIFWPCQRKQNLSEATAGGGIE